jgi:cytochrome c oxidase subunit II
MPNRRPKPGGGGCGGSDLIAGGYHIRAGGLRAGAAWIGSGDAREEWPIVHRSRPARAPGPGARAMALGGAAMVFGACSDRFGAPRPASAQGEEVLDLWRVLFLVAAALGALVVGLLAWVVLRYRRPKGAATGDLPVQRRENVPLELFYTAVPLVIVAVVFTLTMRAQGPVTNLTRTPSLRVEVTGFQWGWRFVYPAQRVTVVGDSNRPPTLVLPVDRTTRLRLVSPDVIHAFYVPSFLIKRDVIPGVDNDLDVRPTEVGRFGGVCAEFCGLDHGRMTFDVEVVELEQFDQWAARQQEQEQPGGPGGPDRDGAEGAGGRALGFAGPRRAGGHA